MGLVKTLIHVHTTFSFDSNISPEGLVRFAARERFGCVIVTDHDTIEGARRVASLTDIQVVIGEEISTRDGHLLGLFLEQPIRPGMSLEDTVLAIRGQGGLVAAPHPFVRFAGCGIGDRLWDIVEHLDAVEVFNAQCIVPGPNRKAKRAAAGLNLPGFAGSDSHSRTSIGPSYQIMPAFDCPVGFLQSLRRAKLVERRHPLSYFAAAAYRSARHLAGFSMPSGFGVDYPPNVRTMSEVDPHEDADRWLDELAEGLDLPPLPAGFSTKDIYVDHD